VGFYFRDHLLGDFVMRETRITFPELGLVAGTRAALGAGLGLLLADRLSAGQRKAVGWTLFVVGALSTIPLALEILGGGRLSAPAESQRQARGGSRSEANEHPHGALVES
jgi:hypothetical protein